MATYEVPESKRSIRQNQFEFKVPGDRRTYRIPKAKYLPAGVIEAISSKGESKLGIKDLLDLFDGGGADKVAAAAVRTLDSEQLENLTKAWQQDSGIGLGESSASTDS